MTKLKKIIERADQKCHEKGSRLTTKRKHVLSALVSSPTALSAYEVVNYCKHTLGQDIPPMSVYRILDFLEAELLVHKLSLANKYVACAHICCDHAHEVPQFLICRTCHQVKEIGIKKSIVKNLRDNVNEAGFHLVSPQIEINCVCNECIKK